MTPILVWICVGATPAIPHMVETCWSPLRRIRFSSNFAANTDCTFKFEYVSKMHIDSNAIWNYLHVCKSILKRLKCYAANLNCNLYRSVHQFWKHVLTIENPYPWLTSHISDRQPGATMSGLMTGCRQPRAQRLSSGQMHKTLRRALTCWEAFGWIWDLSNWMPLGTVMGLIVLVFLCREILLLLLLLWLLLLLLLLLWQLQLLYPDIMG